MAKYYGFLRSLPSLNHFYYEGSFSSHFEYFESRTRIPREALPYSFTLAVGVTSAWAVLRSYGGLVRGCGITITLIQALALFFSDLCRRRLFEKDNAEFWIIFWFVFYWLHFQPATYDRPFEIDPRVKDFAKWIVLHCAMSANKLGKKLTPYHLYNVNMNHWSPAPSSTSISSDRRSTYYFDPSTILFGNATEPTHLAQNSPGDRGSHRTQGFGESLSSDVDGWSESPRPQRKAEKESSELDAPEGRESVGNRKNEEARANQELHQSPHPRIDADATQRPEDDKNAAINPRRKNLDYGRLFHGRVADLVMVRHEASQTLQEDDGGSHREENAARSKAATITKSSHNQNARHRGSAETPLRAKDVMPQDCTVVYSCGRFEGNADKLEETSENFRDMMANDLESAREKGSVQGKRGERHDATRIAKGNETTITQTCPFGNKFKRLSQQIGLCELLEYSHTGLGSKIGRQIKDQCGYTTDDMILGEAVAKDHEDSKNRNANNTSVRTIETTKDIAQQKLLEEAENFLNAYFESEGWSESRQHRDRLHEVKESIRVDGYYEHTREELIYGAKKAFRDTASCLGRKDWESLQVFDCRRIHDQREIFNACCNHIKYATNGGRIRPTITIFRQTKPNGEHVRIWNQRLICFAGYKTLNGTVTGDPATLYISKLCRHMGWKSGVTNWDVLPLLIQIDGTDPQMFAIPRNSVKTVIIRHPRYIKLETLNLHWYAFPSTANMALKIGGIEYGAAPFSGIHVASAIARGPFNSETRYNYSAEVGKAMDLDVTKDPAIWRERAIEALEEAILYSFQTQGVTIFNDETIAEMVEGFSGEMERTSVGCALDLQSCTGEVIQTLVDPSIVEKYRQSKTESTPRSPTTSIAHFNNQDESYVQKYMWNRFRKGVATQHQQHRVDGIWHRRGRVKAIAWMCRFFAGMIGHSSRQRYHNAHILYTRSHGISHRHAEVLKRMLQDFFIIEVKQAFEFNPSKLKYEDLIILVLESPSNNDWIRNFIEAARSQAKIKNLRFAIVALDSSASPEFGAVADRLTTALLEGGAVEVMPAWKVDELNGQHDALRIWSRRLGKTLLKTFGHGDETDMLQSVRVLTANEKWKIVPLGESWGVKSPELVCKDLERIHGEKISRLRVIKNVEVPRKDKSHRTFITDLVAEDGESMSFCPGDDLGVIPQNHPKLVRLILSRLKPGSPTSETPLLVETESRIDRSYGTMKCWAPPARLPSRFTLKEALTYYLDITTPPSQDILADLVDMTNDQREKKLLAALARDSKTFDRWRVRKVTTFPELLQTFPHISVDPALLLKKFPTLQPRLYAIASSPAEDKIRITTAIVKEKARDSNAIYGVCSNWISSHHEDCLVFAFVRRSESFHLPSDASLPVVMIGAGVSIAPFRSFWNERIKCRLLSPTRPEAETLWGKWGKLILYMGCRSADHEEIIFDKEMRTVIEKNHVHAKFAYSRDSRKREYVMDLLRNDAKNIFKDVVKKGGHIYLSGDENMIHSCKQEIINIFHLEGNMSLETAEKYLEKLHFQGRFHEKNFGLSLHRDEKIEDALKKIAL